MKKKILNLFLIVKKHYLNCVNTIQSDDLNLIKLWKETFNARNKETLIDNYYEYPILKTSIGATLYTIIIHKILMFINTNFMKINVNYYSSRLISR